MADDPAPPQRSRDTPKDLTVVQALRATAQLADRHRDQDPSWAELASCSHAALVRLGIDGETPAGSPGTGTIDRSGLPTDGDARTELVTTLAALERDPDPARVGPALELVRPLAGEDR